MATAAIALCVMAVALSFIYPATGRIGFWAMWACCFAAILLMILSVKVP